jgi:hypothetical protein
MALLGVAALGIINPMTEYRRMECTPLCSTDRFRLYSTAYSTCPRRS